MIFIDYPALHGCINPYSFGEICVLCNACGRWNKSTQKQCALNLYKELLKREYEFNDWINGVRELQEKNREANIAYYKRKIAEIEGKESEDEVQ